MSADRRQFVRIAFIIAIVFGGTAVLSVLGGAIVSAWYWGYPFERPSVSPLISVIKSVESLTPVATHEAGGVRMFAHDNDAVFWFAGSTAEPRERWIRMMVEYSREDPYYCLEERIAATLLDRGVIDRTPPPVSDESLGSLFELIESTAVLVDDDPGYSGSRDLTGILLEATTSDERRLLILSLTSMDVSNDHRGFYELIYDRTDPSTGPVLIGRTQFFYDVAGIEGMDWRSFAMLLIIPSAILTFGFGCVLAVTLFRSRSDA